ncbi:MAG: hypothetical protein HYR84_09250 [Planctomycetes bacterium]|nr:hypothetical protein [Planctomycetota bacterium]
MTDAAKQEILNRLARLRQLAPDMSGIIQNLELLVAGPVDGSIFDPHNRKLLGSLEQIVTELDHSIRERTAEKKWSEEAPWEFATDGYLKVFCRAITEAMVRQFGITEDEAVARINREFKRCSFRDGYGLLDTQPAEYWANETYYTEESFWWIEGENRESLGLGPREPRPFP